MQLETGHRPSVEFNQGFTLIELLLVMALMAIILSVAYPSLKGFFHGRNLDNEARRFLSLTRYGQSRAVSEGVPMELWIDAKGGAYGLRAASGYTDSAGRENTFPLDSTIQLLASPPPTTLTRSNYWTQGNQQAGKTLSIRFQPDGFISETSPENIYLRQGTEGQVWIAETTNHLRYDIQIGQPNAR